MSTLTVLWLLFALAVGYLARQRGRGPFRWFLISAVISPLLGFVILMMLKDLALADAIDTVTHDLELTHVKCPHCAEYISPEASVCPHCRNPVTPQPDFVKKRLEEKLAETKEIQATKQGNLIIGLGILAGLSLMAWLFTFVR